VKFLYTDPKSTKTDTRAPQKCTGPACAAAFFASPSFSPCRRKSKNNRASVTRDSHFSQCPWSSRRLPHGLDAPEIRRVEQQEGAGDRGDLCPARAGAGAGNRCANCSLLHWHIIASFPIAIVGRLSATGLAPLRNLGTDSTFR
jgi:hypothetical protein